MDLKDNFAKMAPDQDQCCNRLRLKDKKLWGGGGNFRAAGIFFRHQIPSINFF